MHTWSYLEFQPEYNLSYSTIRSQPGFWWETQKKLEFRTDLYSLSNKLL